LARTPLNGLFASAHFLIFPASSSEGWPKVLSEGMAHGVVPVAGSVSSIPQFLNSFQTGRTCPPDDVEAFVDVLVWYAQNPNRWKEESAKGVQAAQLFSYRNYLQAVRTIFDLSDARPPKGYLDNGFVAERY
jgi:glycosyltransferase involved in cell wall biosynthesis